MIIISPAKKINFNAVEFRYDTSKPVFEKKTNNIVKKLKNLSQNDIKSLMKVSENISDLNYDRFQNFSLAYSEKNQKPAIFLFSGDTYKGLDIQSFNLEELNLVQKTLRILSGLYGLLKPLDNIQPYRLEMGTNTHNLINKSLYDYWSADITDELNKDIVKNKSKNIFNLASKEYFKCINERKLKSEVITPHFQLIKNGKITSAGMLSKKCRGAMVKYIIKNKSRNIDELRGFEEFNFKYDHIDLEKKNIFFLKKI